uniref:Uncharacterized protein n=1 Tax=viral metagenome TaxID=1070528 RepID=A0A6C0BAC6_9ZZZZ
MFFENYFNFDFLIFPELDPFPIPKKRKKYVRFNDSITEYIIPLNENLELWWSKTDLENTKKELNQQFITFMETYYNNQLYFFRKLPTRREVRRAFFDYISK